MLFSDGISEILSGPPKFDPGHQKFSQWLDGPSTFETNIPGPSEIVARQTAHPVLPSPIPYGYIVLCRTFHIAWTWARIPTPYFCVGQEGVSPSLAV